MQTLESFNIDIYVDLKLIPVNKPYFLKVAKYSLLNSSCLFIIKKYDERKTNENDMQDVFIF